ncbi:hypothetical protein ACFSX9_07945 [Flavobacterium ardleyense]|uniref:DUF4836 family protein n=1 Tax=Flavobacterium ardleyense TaxID=2038737 RepID=A0ABW5Z7M7_9FLAO
MKKIFYFLFLFPALLFSQGNQEKYDYFIHFNTPQFSKKVSIDKVLEHKVFKSFTSDSSNVKLNEFISYLDESKSVVINGNFSDSISYYQITFHIKDVKGLHSYIQSKVDASNLSSLDSIADSIKTYANYSVYSPKEIDNTFAWNDSNFIIYESFPSYNYAGIANYETAADSTYYDEEYDEEYIDEVAPVDNSEYAVEVYEQHAVEEVTVQDVVAIEAQEATWEEEEYEEEYEEDYDNEEYYKQLEEQNRLESIAERKKKQVIQEEQIALLFENGFEFPTSTKINPNADIAAWVNYQNAYERINSFVSMFKYIFSIKENPSVAANMIKGMSLDIFFENDKARAEQTIEYSEALASVMQKIISRKPNKNIFNYFPKENPLAFMSYHFSTKDALKSYPELTEQMMAGMPFEKEDAAIAIDLITTIVDEEAVATLFDGDLSMFLHSVEQYEHTYTSTTYDEDYEEINEEKTIIKTRPVFSMVMTSSHPTMLNKLLDLGVRKNEFEKKNNYYIIKEATELGTIALIKDGDVFVITNGLNYLNNGSKSKYAKQMQKQLSKNSLYGNLDMQRFIKSMMTNNDLGNETEKLLQMSNQFKNIELKSSKKLKGNKMKLELEMNSNYSDKNIVLQALDLFNYLD